MWGAGLSGPRMIAGAYLDRWRNCIIIGRGVISPGRLSITDDLRIGALGEFRELGENLGLGCCPAFPRFGEVGRGYDVDGFFRGGGGIFFVIVLRFL